MQAITTRYLPATNHKPSRIKASCDAGELTISYPHEYNNEEAHVYACKLLCEKLDAENRKKYGEKCENTWSNTPKIHGQMSNGDYAHCLVSDKWLAKLIHIRTEANEHKAKAVAEERANGQSAQMWTHHGNSDLCRKDAIHHITHGRFFTDIY